MTAYMRLLVFTWSACEGDCAVVLICTEYGLAGIICIGFANAYEFMRIVFNMFFKHSWLWVHHFLLCFQCLRIRLPLFYWFPDVLKQVCAIYFSKAFQLCKSLLLFVSNVSVIQKRESLETKTNKHHDFETISRCDTTRRR